MTFLDNLTAAAFDRLYEEELTRDVRSAVADRLIAWLSTETRLVPRNDLPQLIADFSDRIRALCEDVEIKVEDSRLVVIAKGADSDTLARLKRGSSWFEGTGGIEALIVATVFQNIRRI